MSASERRPKAPHESSAKRTISSIVPASDVGLQADPVQVGQWLSLLFPGTPGFLVVSHKDAHGVFRPGKAFDDRDELVREVIELDRAGAESIYLRATTVASRPRPGRRGGADDAFMLPGYWADVDYGTFGHKHDPAQHGGRSLPADADEARQVVANAGLPDPTVWVESGGGLYPFWLFDEPVDLSDPQVRALHARALRRLQGRIATAAVDLGLHYDTEVGDLARVLRLPGTVNRKDGGQRPSRREGMDGDFFDPVTLSDRVLEVASERLDASSLPVTCQPDTRSAEPAGSGVFERFAGDVSFDTLLTEADWTRHNGIHARGVAACFTRPGDDVRTPCSAHVLDDAPGVLVVWSSAAGLPSGSGQRLTMGRVFAHLWHGGDEHAAAKDLSAAYAGRPSTEIAARLVGTARQAGTAKSGSTALPDSRRYVDPRDGLRVATLAGDVDLQVGPFAAGPGDSLWVYRNGVYVPDEHHTATRDATFRLLGESFRESHLRNVVLALKAAHTRVSLPTGPSLGPDRFLNVENGLVDWLTGELHPHSPDVASVHRVPARWDPEAVCPSTSEFLSEIFGDDPDIQSFIDEVVGAVLYGGRPFHQRAVMLLGRGKNGKGAFLTWIRSLVGDANVSEVKPQALDTNRFAAAQLYGKLANLAGDVAPTAFQSAERFKEVTAGDVIEAERKYGQPFSFTPVATILASFNEMPTTADRSEGFFRRWLVVPFPHRFVDTLTGAQDERLRRPDATARAITASERSGYLNRAVSGLRRLHERGEFAPPDAVRTATDDYRELGDPVVAMLKAHYQPKSDAFMPRGSIWGTYKGYVDSNGGLPMSAARLYEHLPNAAFAAWGIQVSDLKRNGTRGFRGLRESDAPID